MKVKLLVSIAFVCAFMHVASLEAADKKPWTFLVYIAGDNSLAKYADLDLAEMMEVGSNDNVNILAYATVKRPGEEKHTHRYYVQRGALMEIGSTEVKDSGDVVTFTQALEWAHTEYPSDHFALVLWNHGSGVLNRSIEWSRGICFDDTTGHYLSDRDCFATFGWICDKFRGGKKIDLIACDACLMGSVELAYTFQPYADYYVASEETIPGNGFPYADVLAPFIDGSPEPADLAKNWVNVYAQSYGKIKEDYTLSAIDLKQLDPLVSQLNLIAQFFDNQLKMRTKGPVKAQLINSVKLENCVHFAVFQYVDLYQCLNNIRTNIQYMGLDYSKRWYIEKLIKDTLPLIDKAIIANKTSALYNQAHGLSIYFTLDFVDASYDQLLWTEWTKWSQLMQTFIAA